jgi:hypothetical protein
MAVIMKWTKELVLGIIIVIIEVIEKPFSYNLPSPAVIFNFNSKAYNSMIFSPFLSSIVLNHPFSFVYELVKPISIHILLYALLTTIIIYIKKKKAAKLQPFLIFNFL